MIIFSLVAVLTFRFAFSAGTIADENSVAPSVLWLILSFAGMFALWNAFAREKDRSTLNGLAILPVERNVIYLSKVISTLVMLGLVIATTLIFMAVFYTIDWKSLLLPLIAVLMLGSLGFVSVGIMVSGLATHSKGNAFILPVLVGPIVLFTILQPAVTATSELMNQFYVEMMLFKNYIFYK